jgi:peptidoglycan/LPS O-acetylase OafA/YrhL
LFFVLSGFLITSILLEAKGGGAGRYFGSFYARRVLRIFPAHYVYLALLFLLIPLLAPGAHAANHTLAADRLWYTGFLGNILVLIHGAVRPDFFVTGHLWSLAVEEQFYLTWPAIVLLLNRRQLMVACLIIIVAALSLRIGMTAAGVNAATSLTLMPARMDTLAVGALIALALGQPEDFARLRRFLPAVAVGSAAIIAALWLANGKLDAFDRSSYTVGYTLLAFVFGGLVLVAITTPASGMVGRLLTFNVLKTSGKYSYAMYLFHLPIGWLLFQRTSLASSVPSLLGSHLPGELASTAVAFVPTFAIAWLSWRVLEGPCLRLKDLFPYARTVEPANSAPRNTLTVRQPSQTG